MIPALQNFWAFHYGQYYFVLELFYHKDCQAPNSYWAYADLEMILFLVRIKFEQKKFKKNIPQYFGSRAFNLPKQITGVNKLRSDYMEPR